jgi:hypothetical protein
MLAGSKNGLSLSCMKIAEQKARSERSGELSSDLKLSPKSLPNLEMPLSFLLLTSSSSLPRNHRFQLPLCTARYCLAPYHFALCDEPLAEAFLEVVLLELSFLSTATSVRLRFRRDAVLS